MNIDELFQAGQLKKIAPSKDRAKKSITTAKRYLSEAKQTLAIGISDLTIIAAYGSVFHAARAILFVDGISERSHFAIYEYLKEKHKKFGDELINTFDMYRKLRHSVAYGIDTKVNKEDADALIEFAEEFVEKTIEYLKLK